MKKFLASLTLASTCAVGYAQDQAVYQKGFLSKEDARKSIEVPEGYELQLVLSDPIIKEPVWAVWDGNGVMYVAEMRTYMQDADATGEQKPLSRISRHEDTDGDGVYDKHSVFIDNLLLPRKILALEDRLMVGVTNTMDLWTYRDTDGDGVADEKIKIHEGGKRGGNMEHQPSGLIWAVDNWIYITYNNVRYRFIDGKLVAQKIPQGNGQWGLTQDDDGRLYYSRAGGERPAEGFQRPPQYGMLDTPNQLAKDFKRVYPIDTCPDVQGGPRRVTKTGALNYFTGCAGQEIFRGDRLPGDLYGDLIVPEPVGRLIRRAKVTRKNGQTILTNAYPESEFMRTKDLNFRPVQSTIGPDGCLYIVDMHRGIIQQGNWTRPGSYLRKIIDKWGLAKNVGKGRIYRLVHKDHKPGPRPQMLKESTADLVKHLAHPNGWWRDTAKKLIALRKDRNSVVPALEKLSLDPQQKSVTRTYAMWTLEGISAASSSLVTKLLSDSDPRVQVTAIRLSEKFLEEKNADVIAAIKKLSSATNPEVIVQLHNTLSYVDSQKELEGMKDALVKANANLEIIKIIDGKARAKSLQAEREAKQRAKNAKLAKSMERGKTIYAQLCHTCHGQDGKGQQMAGNKDGVTLAPSLIGTPRVKGSGEALIRVLLQGMTGPIDGKTYPGMMMPMQSNDDVWIADIANYIRNQFGNEAPMLAPHYVNQVRRKTASRKTPWTQEELTAIEPPAIGNKKKWKLTASHNQKGCNALVDNNIKSRYTTNAAMEEGMWLQVELPQTKKLSALKIDQGYSKNDYARSYKIELSSDAKSWKTVATGKGKSTGTHITFPAVKAKFVRISQTENISESAQQWYWSMHELNIYGF
ncbi:MAG: discoidin domain-containing protein [Akkermansiaceae bacterium]